MRGGGGGRWTVLVIWVVLVARSAAERSVLVVLETEEYAQKYMKLIGSLQDDGFSVKVKSASDKSFSIYGDEDFEYAGVVLACPAAKSIGKDLNVENIVKYLEAGNHVFLAAAPRYSDLTEKIAREIGVQIDEKKHMVMDHINFHSGLDDGKHTTVVAGGHAVNKPLTAGEKYDNVIFRGVGASLLEDNELVEKLLWGSSSSYSAKQNAALPYTPISGKDLVLAATVQSRVQSRAVYIGSTEVLTDDFRSRAGSDTDKFIGRLVSWTFGDRGVLRAENLRHSRLGEDVELDTYRVKDKLSVRVNIFEWIGSEAAWRPLDESDVQIEFTSLNPYVRARLIADGNGTFSATIPAPDHIGIYKLTVDYYRSGYTPLIASKTLSIRPYLHNEYERFIFRASPFYLACLLNMVGVLLFAFVYLYGRQNSSANNVDNDKSKERKNQ
mmetsp:Transcript_11081/g.33988  ORF Transcript_11081/g.33988 Transcript_11081/m.33988 type:complete len:440 (+) Transcript_11081:167-1486(+)|eukprot:CAMPEP_0198736678 /NCGR_PEP_ID=MMETSP1475-20131203/67481_1 /TAXON_ID= ORGANISM="Unidentified sp., Strain CCMP1999" /NCGR_SAMPLE_ID=MMETSP1475 /ASSEMBLY_ACC=CAM_ASM_001111 /LENGTH=439 /DNA_ID=CAMNT_0044500527 /DNA_START=151 /DNA_END=1470 /DNA_ORIENTATION=+